LYLNATKTTPAATAIGAHALRCRLGCFVIRRQIEIRLLARSVARGDRIAMNVVLTVKDDTAIPGGGRRLLASVLVLYAS
jgi:hypothetical protein